MASYNRENELTNGSFAKGFQYDHNGPGEGMHRLHDDDDAVSDELSSNLLLKPDGIHDDHSEPGQDGRLSADRSGQDLKPRILIMGLRRSGKSSIQKVVFHKMAPNETLFLESTNKIIKDDISNNSFVSFAIWDFPGQIDFLDPTFDSDHIFGHTGALVFVIDAQDDYSEALNKLNMTVTGAYRINPDIRFEVFIHKVDGLSDDSKIDVQRDIHQRANDELIDQGYDGINLSFYLTSIYDHSIFEAFSKVVQKLIPQLATLENLLNIFISNSGIEKAFLFDVVSKIYIATDSAPVDMQSYELCCDMIDVVIDVSCIYGGQTEVEGATFDTSSWSIIKLNNSTILYLREVNKFLALVCILREENFDKQGLIDYNFLCFRDAIQEVFDIKLNKGKIAGDTSRTPNSDLGKSPLMTVPPPSMVNQTAGHGQGNNYSATLHPNVDRRLASLAQGASNTSYNPNGQLSPRQDSRRGLK